MAIVCAALALAGCRSGPKNFDNENDDLRRKNLELNQQVESLTRQRDETLAKLAEAQRMASWDGQDLAASVRQALPRCAAIEFGILSGPADTDNLPGFDAVDIYIVPRDGMGRFVQIVGSVDIRVDLLPGLSEEPLRLGSMTLGPEQLRAAYRSGFIGTHYTARITPAQPIDPGSGSIAMSIEFVDALTGVVHQARRVIEVPSQWR